MAYRFLKNERETAAKYLPDLERALVKITPIAPWISVPLLLALVSRETGWGWVGGCVPRNGSPNLTGDHGHGRGFFQIDDRDRSGNTSFIQHGFYTWGGRRIEGSWAAVEDACLYACRMKLHRDHVILAKHYADPEAGYWAAVAAYNCGAGAVMKSLKNPDARTSGKNYSRDVKNRMMTAWLPWYWDGVRAALAAKKVTGNG